MNRQSNVSIVLKDDDGLFIRYGTTKFRPQSVGDAKGLARGKTVRAWPADASKSGLKVDTADGQRIWPRV